MPSTRTCTSPTFALACSRPLATHSRTLSRICMGQCSFHLYLLDYFRLDTALRVCLTHIKGAVYPALGRCCSNSTWWLAIGRAALSYRKNRVLCVPCGPRQAVSRVQALKQLMRCCGGLCLVDGADALHLGRCPTVEPCSRSTQRLPAP